MKDLGVQIKGIFDKIDHSDWVNFKFRDIAENIVTKVKPKPEDSIKYIGLEHLDPSSIHIRRWGTEIDLKGEKIQMKKGDVIFGKRNAYLRRASVAPFDGICSAHAMVLRARPTAVESDFFPFFMNSDYFMDRAVMISVGSLSPTINWPTLAKEIFRLPPRPIQKRLAELLWTVDNVSESLNNSLINLISYKKVFLEKVILSTKGSKIVLKEIGRLIRGVGYKPTDMGKEYSENYYPILRSNNIQDSSLNYDSLYHINKKRIKDDQLLRGGDIVICMSNGNKELVGKAAVFDHFKMPISFGSFCAVFRPNRGNYESIIKYLFQTDSYKKHIQSLLTGSNINNLKPSDIESMVFYISREALKKDSQRQLLQLSKTENNITNYLADTRNLVKIILNKLLTL